MGQGRVFTLTATNTGTKTVTVKGAKSDGSDEVVLTPQDLVVPPGSKADFNWRLKCSRGWASLYERLCLVETTDSREKTIPIRYLIRLPQVTGR